MSGTQLDRPHSIVPGSNRITYCSIFNRGMRCFDTYSKRCLDDRKLGTFKNNVQGARRFFYKFCGDADFRRGKFCAI